MERASAQIVFCFQKGGYLRRLVDRKKRGGRRASTAFYPCFSIKHHCKSGETRNLRICRAVWAAPASVLVASERK